MSRRLLIAGLACLRCRRGIAATEFAVVLPLMLLLLMGSVEIGNAFLLDRKVTRAAQIGADLVAQVEVITQDDLTDIMDAMGEVLKPFAATSSRVVLSSVYHDPDTAATQVDWSVARGTSARAVGSTFQLPGDLAPEGDSVIVVEIEYDLTPLYADAILGDLTILDVAYLRPRRTTRIVLD